MTAGGADETSPREHTNAQVLGAQDVTAEEANEIGEDIERAAAGPTCSERQDTWWIADLLRTIANDADP